MEWEPQCATILVPIVLGSSLGGKPRGRNIGSRVGCIYKNTSATSFDFRMFALADITTPNCLVGALVTQRCKLPVCILLIWRPEVPPGDYQCPCARSSALMRPLVLSIPGLGLVDICLLTLVQVIGSSAAVVTEMLPGGLPGFPTPG